MLTTSATPARSCPLAKMYTLGCGFIPSANHAGGLRYHGMSPILSKLYHDGYMRGPFRGADQGIRGRRAVCPAWRPSCPRPESAHAIRAAIDEALKLQGDRRGKDHPLRPDRYRLFRHGRLHRSSTTATMTDYIPTDEELQASFQQLPQI